MDPEDPLEPLEAALREVGFNLNDPGETLYAVKLSAIKDLMDMVYRIARIDVESQMWERQNRQRLERSPYENDPYYYNDTKTPW